jgi:hypothetical protein
VSNLVLEHRMKVDAFAAGTEGEVECGVVQEDVGVCDCPSA